MFADTIKGQGFSWQSNWHFVNNPYLDESKNIGDYNFIFDPQNVTQVITDINAWMLALSGYKTSTTYTTIM